ncbi:COX15/CtaA family protein [Algihabitans albus]|uniref:COX15/CtaA family protein n=1 Tax=Algihabitans albus TaxID=2164067 RepID=UPI001F3BCBF3|nr:COX15/CtaA family protein [Algihabitans albus]
MTFSLLSSPRSAAPSEALATPRAVALWLLGVAALIFAMAVIGAITRLTESGLSIMEWAPVSGFLPPLSAAEWERLLELYRRTAEYQQINRGMTLSEFQEIFWWEWIHRQWGRLIGLAYALPLAWFWLRGRLPGWIKPHLLFALGLGALQGFMGWFMVASGFFGERTDVSQYRLVLHLSLALIIYAYLLWLALSLLRGSATAPEAVPLRLAAKAFAGLLAVTVVSGGFVAGTNAGMTYNTFPLMDGQLIPAGYAALQPWWMNWFETIAAIQFNHRLLAVTTAGAALLLWLGSRRRDLAPAMRQGFVAVAGVALVQTGLGIVTLLLAVPVWLGALHQAGALCLIAATVFLLHSLRRASTAL